VEIIIKNKKTLDIDSGWQFLVLIEDSEYLVDVEKEYWQELTNGKEDPEQLVVRSFEFLLSKESKKSILSQFNLKLIQKYFPEYENEIKR